MAASLITPETKVKVSSTLDKSVGKKYLTDGSAETCWTSGQGTPQYIQLAFPVPVTPTKVSLTFQGGFVGIRCAIHTRLHSPDQPSEWRFMTHVFPEDVNRRQTFDMSPIPDPPSERTAGAVDQIKLVFEESSDFFGRITVYDLGLEGYTHAAV
ncbi:galactose-binding like protein [Gautieria morchelliformis]|nr:galactose-binding like protein [Gautieria morchelliformis]